MCVPTVVDLEGLSWVNQTAFLWRHWIEYMNIIIVTTQHIVFCFIGIRHVFFLILYQQSTVNYSTINITCCLNGGRGISIYHFSSKQPFFQTSFSWASRLSPSFQGARGWLKFNSTCKQYKRKSNDSNMFYEYLIILEWSFLSPLTHSSNFESGN